MRPMKLKLITTLALITLLFTFAYSQQQDASQKDETEKFAFSTSAISTSSLPTAELRNFERKEERRGACELVFKEKVEPQCEARGFVLYACSVHDEQIKLYYRNHP